MTRDDEQGKGGIFGRGLPGTGGDLRISDDDQDDQDVEGHLALRDGGPDGLYTGGPKTQGEFTRRGPGENPHGER
jgi:hypothetical protein